MSFFSTLAKLYRPAPAIPRLPTDQVDKMYRKQRILNFAAIFLGYASYYLVRNNFSLAMPYLKQEYGYSNTTLGLIIFALPAAYGISKFIMGNVSDRSNSRYFIVTGLFLSTVVALIFGCVPAVATSVDLMWILMALNGWAQGMGAGPCYRTVAHWFPHRKRGLIMAAWNPSHNIGAALLGLFASRLVVLGLPWRAIFYVPAIIVILTSVVILVIMRDTPQSVGLMPIEEYEGAKNSTAKDTGTAKKSEAETERELTAKEILFKYVLVNKYIWFLAFANIFVYFVRYGIVDWTPTYLSAVKGLTITKSSGGVFTYEMAGILGMLLCGYISDKFLGGKRAPLSIACMVLVTLGILAYWIADSVVVINTALFMVGMCIYGPVMLVGVQAIDIMSKKAIGTAIGFLGLAGYWGGRTLGSYGIGIMSEHFSWDAVFIVMLIACVLAVIFFSLTASANNSNKTR